VPESAALRIDLSASRRAGVAAAFAQTLSAATAAACALAVLLAPSPLRIAAAVASAMALLLSLRVRRRSASIRVGVDADGELRAGAGGAGGTATVRYCAPEYVCLQTGRELLPVWPDSMPAADWRRLLVGCRWSRGRDRNGGGTPAGARTK